LGSPEDAIQIGVTAKNSLRSRRASHRHSRDDLQQQNLIRLDGATRPLLFPTATFVILSAPGTEKKKCQAPTNFSLGVQQEEENGLILVNTLSARRRIVGEFGKSIFAGTGGIGNAIPTGPARFSWAFEVRADETKTPVLPLGRTPRSLLAP